MAGTEYTYSITAVLGDHWQSPSVSASATTLAVATASLELARVGEPYSMALSAVGGSGPYAWALAPSSSELPSWATSAPRQARSRVRPRRSARHPGWSSQ